jgi:hypothetical protein
MRVVAALGRQFAPVQIAYFVVTISCTCKVFLRLGSKYFAVLVVICVLLSEQSLNAPLYFPWGNLNKLGGNTGWRRETVKFEIIRKKRRKLTQLYLILKMCSTRVEISLGITF